jgi:hypothetical protein
VQQLIFRFRRVKIDIEGQTWAWSRGSYQRKFDFRLGQDFPDNFAQLKAQVLVLG